MVAVGAAEKRMPSIQRNEITPVGHPHCVSELARRVPPTAAWKLAIEVADSALYRGSPDRNRDRRASLRRRARTRCVRRAPRPRSARGPHAPPTPERSAVDPAWHPFPTHGRDRGAPRRGAKRDPELGTARACCGGELADAAQPGRRRHVVATSNGSDLRLTSTARWRRQVRTAARCSTTRPCTWPSEELSRSGGRSRRPGRPHRRGCRLRPRALERAGGRPLRGQWLSQRPPVSVADRIA